MLSHWIRSRHLSHFRTFDRRRGHSLLSRPPLPGQSTRVRSTSRRHRLTREPLAYCRPESSDSGQTRSRSSQPDQILCGLSRTREVVEVAPGWIPTRPRQVARAIHRARKRAHFGNDLSLGLPARRCPIIWPAPAEHFCTCGDFFRTL